MEYEEQDDYQDGNFFQRLKESPRTVSALIIILIIAAAIYAFSGDENGQDNDDIALQESTQESEQAVDGEATEEGVESDDAMATSSPSASDAMEANSTPTPVAMDELKKTVEGESAVEKAESGYAVVAVKGDGLTHLARRAAAQYLTENTADFTVTNEHRIYIEDYIKDHMTRKPVSIGQQETISFDLIREAVEHAGTLTDSQLHNLTKYTPALS